MKALNLLASIAAAAALMACTEVAEPEPDPNAAIQLGEAQTLPRTLPPLTDVQARYVGQWATSAEGCTDPSWRFEERQVSTRGEISCTFDNVTLTENGYDIAATCFVEAPAAPYQIQLSFAESAQAMMTSGAPWAATSLVYCGP